MKILLLPSDHGGGKGHVSRCLYLGNELKKLDHHVGIVLEKKHSTEGLRNGLETFVLETNFERFLKYQFRKPHKCEVALKNSILSRPFFLEFNGLSYQSPRDGYLNEKIVNFRFSKLSKFIKTFNPDILIGDTFFLTHLLGKKFNLPVIQITRLAGFPPSPDFMWWKDSSSQLIEPDGLKPFITLLEKLKLNGYSRVEDLLKGDRYIIPANEAIEPIPENEADVIFTGPFTSDLYDKEKIPFFEKNDNLPKIYVTIGGGSSRSNEKLLFESILNGFNKKNFCVLVSTGRRVIAESLNGRSDNVLFVDWISGISAIKQCDLVIFHGGYGTSMEVLLSGKPSLIIPAHSEQEGNARRFESLEVGKTVLLHKPGLKPLVYEWTYGKFQMLGGFEYALNDIDMSLEVEMILQWDNKTLTELSQSLKELQNNIDLNNVINL